MGAKKKRRKAARETAARQVAEAEKEAALAAQRQTEQYRQAEAIAKMRETTPGQLSPYAKAEYASDLERIVRTYRNLRESGMAAATQRGLGRSPSGLASIANTSTRLQGEAETDAYRRALASTGEDQWRLLGYRTGQTQFFDPAQRRGLTTGLAQTSLQMNPASDPWSKIAQIVGAASGIGGMFAGGGAGAPKAAPRVARAPVSSTIPMGSGTGFPTG